MVKEIKRARVFSRRIRQLETHPSREPSDLYFMIAAFLIETLDKPLGEVGLVPLDDAGLVVAGGDLQKPIRERCKKLGRLINQQVEIIAADVLGPELRRVSAPIPLALHRAEQVADVNDVRVALACLLEMTFLECLIAMRVVVVSVAR
ncbi:MAG: hypothetical protein GY904_11940 [Planctomycetaceae bacterium]|nr:hypothetical protein [Planctomycetaceae bacterium]